MSEYFINLKDKYGYDDDFIHILSKIIDVLISYYGDDMKDPILSKISSVNIHVKSDMEDANEYISSYLGVYDNHLPYDSITGYATTRPSYKDGIISSKSLIYLFDKIDYNNLFTCNVLVHELCHLVKQRDFYVEEDHICGGTGLQKEVYDFDGNLLSRKFSSLEEASNSHDELCVMRLLCGDYYLENSHSNYCEAERFYAMLIDDMKEFDENFAHNVVVGGFDYFSSVFSLFGLYTFDNLFDECIGACCLKEKDLYKKNIDELYRFYYILKKSFIPMLSKN